MREQNTNRVSPFLPGSLRWQTRQGEAPANRWRDWAQTLSERHSRIALGQGILSLIFAQPQTLIFSRIERWRQAALKFSPQIKLAINQILQPTDRHESEARFAAQSRTVFVLRALTTDERGVGGQGRLDSAREGFSDSGLQMRDGFMFLQPPLRRVFARTGPEDANLEMIVSRSRQETLLVRSSLQFAQQAVYERQRLEEQTRRALVIHEQRIAPMTKSEAAQRETVFQSPLGSRVGATGMNRFAPMPINIEQLTDQVVRNIDQRIVAHRERMGRVF